MTKDKDVNPTSRVRALTTRPTDQGARELARRLINTALYGSLGVVHPDTGKPHVTRIALGTDANGFPITLISDLSLHTRALKLDNSCSLLIGQPESKGDPLTYPRLTIEAKAVPVLKEKLRNHYLESHPKSKLYIDFADFNFVRFEPISADLNGGFGKAFQLTAEDLQA